MVREFSGTLQAETMIKALSPEGLRATPTNVGMYVTFLGLDGTLKNTHQVVGAIMRPTVSPSFIYFEGAKVPIYPDRTFGLATFKNELLLPQ